MRSILTIAIAFALTLLAAPAADAAALVKAPNGLGLAGWWTFDDATSTAAYDRSGNGATATFSSSPAWVDGKRGKALDFDGTDDYLVTPLSRSSYSAVTVAAWIKYEGSVSATYVAIFAGQSADFFVGKNTGNSNIGVQDGGYNGSTAVGTNAWDGNWHHVAYTFSGGTGTVYVDGRSVGTSTFSGGTGAIWIGQENEGSGYDFNGKIDDARVYGRALTAAEVAALYASGQSLVNGSENAMVADGLVGLWSFNNADVDNSAIYNRGSSAAHGFLVGNATSAARTIGKVSQAFEFDGLNDHVRVPYSAALAPTAGISFGGWFKTTNRTLSQKIVSKTEGGGFAIVINESVGGCSGTSICAFVGVNTGVNTYYGAGVDRSAITNGQWHHVMGTYDGETVSLYLDGALVSTNTTPSGPVNFAASNPLCIGTEPDGSNCGVTQFFSGAIDEVRVYSRALSAAEVRRLAAPGAAVNVSQNGKYTDGLVAYWTFNGSDMADAGISDVSGNGSAAYVVGTAATSSLKGIGRVGQGLVLNGTNNFVGPLASTSSNTISTNQVTVSAWVKPATSSSIMTVVSNDRDCGGCGSYRGYGMQIFYGGTTQFRVWNDNGSGPYAAATGQLPTVGEWTHIVGTFNGASVRLYMNGTLVSTQSTVGNGTLGFPSTFNTKIGQLGCCSGTHTMNGGIDEVRIYNRGLTAVEVRQLYLLGR